MIEELYQLFLQCSGVTTDSRNCPKDSLFIALKGDNFNGNAFAAKALEAGCKYVVIDEAEYMQEGDGRYFLVKNGLRALQQLANYHRQKLGIPLGKSRSAHTKGIPIIGITGTNGKTTTKELTAAVLSKKFNVLYTQGNLNNSIGVPLTLLRMKPEHQIAIIEMGASHPGDIQELVNVAEPNIGLITNVGRAHLLGFGSFEGVKRTKGELYDFIKATHGEVIINIDSADLMQMFFLRGLENPITYGTKTDDVDVKGSIVGHGAFLHFQWQSNDIQTKLIGDYNLSNMLAAIAIGCRYGVPAADICDALRNYEPHNNRSQLTQTAHNTLIVDAYNANPTSMKAAIDNFYRLQADNKMLILGEMRELGAGSSMEHRQIVQLIQKYDFKDVLLVGEEFIKVGSPFHSFKDVSALIDYIRQEPQQNKTILIKGSNGTKLFTIPEFL
ncbi:MAG: UDP-N-acetylmuramoyl-tripeptide--D-alanyl-D-alanine ligase [Bacteroidaceae bacterium]|nr:UDP-N-acetylmuramoyl-tripeptide--D-alanyl-D-alanine ligase [Bacteroidaceae bacterium]